MVGGRFRKSELVSSLPRLWRYCIGMAKEKQAADDLAQATCLRALERSAQFRGDAKLDRWLIGIARHIWFNQLKAERVRTQGGLIEADSVALDDLVSSPEEKTFKTQVFAAVLDLPEAQREAVLLVYVEGWSYREAADRLEIPIGTVMSRLAAARRKLAALQDTNGPDREGQGTNTPEQEDRRHDYVAHR